MQGFVDFWVGQGPEGFIRIFWFYFFLELPRYVLLDYVYLIIYRLKQCFNKEQYKEARQALWAEQPRVTILIPGKIGRASCRDSVAIVGGGGTGGAEVVA